MEYHYTAREAIERLGLPRRTFYYLVRSGQISKVVLPLRKQSLYLKEEIDGLAAEREQILSQREIVRRKLSFSIPSKSDLAQMHELWQRWGRYLPRWDARAAEWQRYNPEVMHVLKDTSTGIVLGGIMMSPLSAYELRSVMVAGIPLISDPRDCLPFEAPDNAPIDVYVFDLLIRPSLRTTLVAALLLRGIFRFLESLLDRGVVVHRLFTIGTSPHADRLLCKLGFDQLPAPAGGENRGQRYVLNPLAVNPRSKPVGAYQRRYRNLTRRMRRYEQAATAAKTT